MPIADLATEVKRLSLQLERNVVAQAHLRQLLNTADSTVARARVELVILRARLKRTLAKR